MNSNDLYTNRGGENRTPTKGFGDPYDTTSPHPYAKGLLPQNCTLNISFFIRLPLKITLVLSRCVSLQT